MVLNRIEFCLIHIKSLIMVNGVEVCWLALNGLESWMPLNRIESYWIHLELWWIVLNRVELYWILFNRIQLYWILFNPCWIVVNGIELGWLALSGVESYLIVLNRVHRKQQPEVLTAGKNRSDFARMCPSSQIYMWENRTRRTYVIYTDHPSLDVHQQQTCRTHFYQVSSDKLILLGSNRVVQTWRWQPAASKTRLC